MTVSTTPGTLKQFRRTPGRFQPTVERPKAGELERFVSTIIASHGGLEALTVPLDKVAFNPGRISALCPAGTALAHDVSISAESAEERRSLLVAAFWDGPDFIGIPAPQSFVFYADHDDWITFYASTKSHLHRVIEPLSSPGCKLVQNWQREL